MPLESVALSSRAAALRGRQCRTGNQRVTGPDLNTILPETVNPVLNRPWRVAQNARDLQARYHVRHKQHRVEALVVSRLLGPLNLLLQQQEMFGSSEKSLMAS